MTLRKAIAHNTLFNGAGRLWEFLAGLILLRVVVEYIGVGQLGLWALIAPFIGYVALLDLGIGSGFARYVAEHAARDDEDALSAVVSTGFFYYVIFGTLLVFAGWPAAAYLLNAVDYFAEIPPNTQSDLLFLLRGGLVLFAAANCFAAFTAVQTGLQRMGITNGLSVASSIVKLGATVAFLEWGFGVRGLLFAEMAATLVFGLCSAMAAFALRPGLRVGPGRASWRTFRALFNFGWRAQVARLSNLIMFQTDKIVVGAFYSMTGVPGRAPAQIGYYELGVNLANKMRQAPAVLTSALLPAAAHLHTRDERGRLQEMYLRSSKYVALVAIPLAVFVASAAGMLMRTWMGEGFEQSAWILRIIAVGYVANIVPGAGVSIVLGQGDAGRVMMAGIVSMTSNIVLTIALVATIGFWGIPIATSLSMFLSWAWFAHGLRGEFGIGFTALLRRTCLRPALLALPCAAPALALDIYSSGTSAFIANAGFLAFAAASFALMFLAGLYLFPCLDGDDVELIESSLPIHGVPGARMILRKAAGV